MKRIIKLSSLVLCVLLMLTACSAVFDSAISGTVRDRSARETSSTTNGGISDVMVYAYDNESTWNSKYTSWDGESEFTDNSVPSAKTASDGSFSISNLRWLTNNPAYGKDADSKTIYLLAFHKDYGLTKVDGRTIQSDKSNNFGIVYMDKATTTKTLVIKLKDSDESSSTSTGTDSTITSTSEISFKYKYKDYYDGNNQNVSATVDSFTNGTATITVKYKEYDADGKKNAVPTVTIYDIQTGSDWTLVTNLDKNNELQITYNDNDKEYKNTNIYLTSKWKTVSVTVSLIDGSSTEASDSVTDPIDFTWSYNNGEETKTANVITTTANAGSYTISVKFKKVKDGKAYTPTLTLTSFKDNDTDDAKWTWTTSKDNAKVVNTSTGKIELTLSQDKDTVTQKVYFRKNYLTLPSTGISGYLISTTGTEASGYGYTCDYGDELYLYKGDSSSTLVNNYTVTTKRVDSTASTNQVISDYGRFTGLGAGIKLTLTYDDSSSGTVSYAGKAEKLVVKYTKRSDITSSSNPKTQTEAVNGTLEYNSMTTDFSVMLYKSGS